MKPIAAAAAMLALVIQGTASAETREVRLSQSFGLIYVPSYVVAEEALLEKHTKAAGLPGTKLTLIRAANGTIATDMMLTGDADLAATGTGTLFNLWAKTVGTGARETKAIISLSDFYFQVLTIDPKIKSLADFGANDKIAMAGVKVGDFALGLQRAMAKRFGWEERFRLDRLAVVMSAPDGAAMIISGAKGGNVEVKSHATVPPYTVREIEAGARVIFDSRDDAPEYYSNPLVFTMKAFHDANPKVMKAIVAAFEEAMEIIKADPEKAAKIYMKYEPQPQGIEWVAKLISKDMRYSSTPRGLEATAQYLHQSGLLPRQVKSWKDVFWNEIHHKEGN